MPPVNDRLWMTRTVEFSAAHRLYREEWTEEKNRSVFGKCANAFGHGHNYTLDVTLAGPVDPETGMLVHFDSLKKILHETVVTPLDHRHLNHDVDMLKGVLPTLENVVVVLWGAITEALQDLPVSVYRLRLASSPRNWVEYFGPRGQI